MMLDYLAWILTCLFMSALKFLFIVEYTGFLLPLGQSYLLR